MHEAYDTEVGTQLLRTELFLQKSFPELDTVSLEGMELPSEYVAGPIVHIGQNSSLAYARTTPGQKPRLLLITWGDPGVARPKLSRVSLEWRFYSPGLLREILEDVPTIVKEASRQAGMRLDYILQLRRAATSIELLLDEAEICYAKLTEEEG
jgi:hypothetical protein